MSGYAKLVTRGFFSDNSDYSFPIVDTRTKELALAPTTYEQHRLHLSTAATTLDLSGFTTILALLILNESSTAAEVVDAKWAHIKSTRAAGSSYAFADAATGDTCTLAAGGFTASKAVEGDYVRITSSEDAGQNDGRFLVVSASDTVLTTKVGAYWSVGASTPDTAAVLTFERDNIQGIPAGGQLLVTDNVQPLADLVLTAESGTPEVTVFILGT